MTRLYFPKGVHLYNIMGEDVFAEYMGRQKGFECAVCGKGCNAFTFNIIHADIDNYTEALKKYYEKNDFETWGFGRQHIEETVELKNFIQRVTTTEEVSLAAI